MRDWYGLEEKNFSGITVEFFNAHIFTKLGLWCHTPGVLYKILRMTKKKKKVIIKPSGHDHVRKYASGIYYIWKNSFATL